MSRYTVILFYSNGTSRAYNAKSYGDASAIEAGALGAWYSLAINGVNKNYYLTGVVLINNILHIVVQNDTYARKEDTV